MDSAGSVWFQNISGTLVLPKRRRPAALVCVCVCEGVQMLPSTSADILTYFNLLTLTTTVIAGTRKSHGNDTNWIHFLYPCVTSDGARWLLPW